MPSNNGITVKPVGPTNWTDFEALFQSKGAPSYCWCMAWRSTSEELKQNNAENRKIYIRQRIFDKIPVGLLAYRDNQPVAWCSVAPRDTCQRLGGDENLKDVWSLVCFYVKKEHRRSGMVDLLIDHAKKYARKKGAKYLEAYPVEPDSPSYRFMGFVTSFEKSGFKFVKKAGSRRNVMVCQL